MTAPRTLEPTRRPAVRILLAAGQKWTARCQHCTDWAYSNTVKSDVAYHASMHREAHRRAWHAREMGATP